MTNAKAKTDCQQYNRCADNIFALPCIVKLLNTGIELLFTLRDIRDLVLFDMEPFRMTVSDSAL